MFDTAIVRHQPRPVAGAEFVVTVRITAEPGQSVQVAHQIAETLRSAFGAHRPLELVPTTDDATGPVARRLDLEIDVPSRTARLADVELELTRLEFDLLVHLARVPGRVFGRDTLLADVWHTAQPSRTRTVDVHIRRLRGKFGRYEGMIATVRRVGYRIDPDAAVAVYE